MRRPPGPAKRSPSEAPGRVGSQRIPGAAGRGSTIKTPATQTQNSNSNSLVGMVRQVDTPSPMKHLRFGKIVTGLSDILSSFPGVKSIVLHTHGKSGEHPHYHVWWEGESCTNETIRNRLRRHNDVFKSYSGQNDWSCRPHDSFEMWAAYVQRNKTHTVLWTTVDMPPPKDTIELVIATPQTPVIQAPAPRVKKMTEKERLINYFIMEEGFRPNRYTQSHFEPGSPHISRIMKEVRDGLFAYADGRLSNNQLEYMGRHIMYHFADEDLKEALADNWASQVQKKWWSYV